MIGGGNGICGAHLEPDATTGRSGVIRRFPVADRIPPPAFGMNAVFCCDVRGEAPMRQATDYRAPTHAGAEIRPMLEPQLGEHLLAYHAHRRADRRSLGRRAVSLPRLGGRTQHEGPTKAGHSLAAGRRAWSHRRRSLPCPSWPPSSFPPWTQATNLQTRRRPQGHAN